MWKKTILWMVILAISAEAGLTKRRVCIIGTGPAGLIATKYIAEYPDEFEPITFEKQSDVGGMWIYTDSTTVDEHGLPVHSSSYKYLRINGPKELLSFPDFVNFTAGEGSYVPHTVVLEYLRNYTEYYNLRRFIRFDTNVEKVSFTSDEKWLLQVRNLNTYEKYEIYCDVFISGHGHYVTGNIPKIPGIETFPGRVVHSHLFRYPEEFSGQTVVVLGARSSGFDIAIEISSNASTVYLSSRSNKNRWSSVLPNNVVRVAGVVGAEGSELILSDGSRVKADALILATGYLYDMPFLDKSTGISIEEGKYVRPLYRHFINIEHPTMAILNIPTPSYAFLMPHAQIQYFIAMLRGGLKLPSREDMLEAEKLPEGTPTSKAHLYSVTRGIFSYYTDLALASHSKLLPNWFETAIRLSLNNSRKDPVHYREQNLYVYDDGRVEFH